MLGYVMAGPIEWLVTLSVYNREVPIMYTMNKVKVNYNILYFKWLFVDIQREGLYEHPVESTEPSGRNTTSSGEDVRLLPARYWFMCDFKFDNS